MVEYHFYGAVQAAYDGKSAAPLKFYIDGGSLRDGINVESGLYEVPADDMRSICDLLAAEYPHREMTGKAVAEAIDWGAGGDRWVRMSRTVANWIKDKRPTVAVDGVIG